MRLAPQHLRTYFCTFSTAGRRRVFQVAANAELMIATLQHYRFTSHFELHAYVIMPDHVHVLITPAPEVSLEKAVQLMKGGFSFRLKSNGNVWERGHFDKRVPDNDAYRKCVAYIHQNPVKAALCTEAPDFLFSSVNALATVDPMPSWLDHSAAEAAPRSAIVTAG